MSCEHNFPNPDIPLDIMLCPEDIQKKAQLHNREDNYVISNQISSVASAVFF